MLINAIDPEESRIAVVEDGVLQELHVELANREAYLGNIYKGKVVNIEPSIGAAFVAFGGRVNGFLHVSDVLPAYGRDEFRLEDVIEGRARVDLDDGPESMQQALSDDDDEDEEGVEAPVGPRKKRSRRSAASSGSGGDEASGQVDLSDDQSGEASELERVATEDTASEDAASEDVASEDAASEDAESGDSHDDDSYDDDGEVGSDESLPVVVEPIGDVQLADDSSSSTDDHSDETEAVVEAVDDVQVGDEAVDLDDDDEDHGFGFGDGLDERPLAMAAGDSGDDAVGSTDSEPASISDAPSGGDASGGDASGDDASGGDAAQGEAGAPRKRRSRSRRSRSRKKTYEDPAREGEASSDGEPSESDSSVSTAPASRRESGAESRQQPGRQRRTRGPGGRDGRGGGHERRASRGNRPTIDQLLKKGQEVVVQITKEGIGNKGPTLTTYVSLPGRCLVLMPSLPKCGVSRKIADGRERRRLNRIVKELDETGSGGIGFIVRTAGINKSLEDVQRDRDYLKKIWEMVAQRLKITRAPALLYQESDLVLKAMRDQFTPDISDVVVDSEDVYMRIRDFAEKLMPLMSDRIKRHSVTTPLFHSFGIEKDVEELYEPKVDLSNGASIVIDQAEALVAIDVNSGKYKGDGQGSDETAYRTNLESIPEIVRQLRLRDLGGLIIIDFIDMTHEKQRRGVERKLIDALRGDRARIKVGRISPFGMMEITRQRVGPGLKRTVFMQCPHCKGAGWSRTVQSKALSVLREARALVNLKGYSMLQIFVAPAVSDYLVNYKRRAVLELEDAVGKTIVFRPEASYPIDVVHYRFLTGDGQEARVAIPAGLGVKA
jgi:ribonuclease E